MQIKDRVIELRRVRAAELAPNPKRWRRHPEPQQRALRALLEEIGLADACLARETPAGLELIDGHLRRDLDPDALLPVLVLDLDEAEADTLLASLDPLAAMAIPDKEALAELLKTAAPPEEVLEGLVRHCAGLRPVGRTDPEQVPHLPAEPTTTPGGLWLLGEHRLLCGDSRQVGDLQRLLEDELADVLWTDPPYGVDYVGKTPDALTLEGDDADGLAELLADAFGAADQVLSPGARLYVCHPAGSGSLVFAQAFLEAGWRWHQTLVWAKDRMVLGHADYHYRHEPILYGYRPGPGRWGRGNQGWWGTNGADSVFEIPRPAASREHPTAKPVELVRACLLNSSVLGGIVLDPFAGSGSTLMACEELGRRARCIEIDPAYCDVIVRRWEDYTGEKAVLADG